MFRRILVQVLSSIALTFLFLATVSAQVATPPSQPLTGPGGKQSLHASVTKNRYGNGGPEYWIFEP